MLRKNPVALITIGINIISAGLCVPTQFPITATFYRAVILYVINIFVTEIPKWGRTTYQKRHIEILQVVLFIVGFILIAIGVVNVTTPYEAGNLPQTITVWSWIYFASSLLMLFISIFSNLEFTEKSPSGVATSPAPVISIDPSLPKDKDNT